MKKILSTLAVLAASVCITNTASGTSFDTWISMYGTKIEFDVYRKNRKVGTYLTQFDMRDGNLCVDITMRLEIPIFLGWTYDYNYAASEVWRDGKLFELNVEVNDNGDTSSLSAKNIDDELRGNYMDQPVSVKLPILATHHYNADVLDDKRVFNTLTGKENNVDIIKKSADVLSMNGRWIKAHKYLYQGDLEDTQVWYDDKNRWVKMEFLGSDGTPIELRCKTCGV